MSATNTSPNPEDDGFLFDYQHDKDPNPESTNEQKRRALGVGAVIGLAFLVGIGVVFPSLLTPIGAILTLIIIGLLAKTLKETLKGDKHS